MAMGQQGPFTRVVVTLVLVICVGVLIQKAVSFTQLYLSKPTVTSISFREVDDLKFPAVTLCEDRLRDEVKTSGVAMLEADQRPVYQEFPFNSTSVSKFMWQYSYRFNDMITNCKVGSVSCLATENTEFQRVDDLK